MALALGQILAGVPMGWNDAENSRMKRLLEQGEFDTAQRQAPLRDDLLRAQAQHLRMAGQLRFQERSQENAANMAYWKALNAPGGQAPSLMPPPMGNALQPPTQTVQANPVAGFQGQTPFVGASMPQGTQPQPFQGLSQTMGGQPGPIQGAQPMPQAPPDNPFQMAIQQRQQALERIRSTPLTPDIARAGIQIDQEIRQLQQAEMVQKLKLDEELRRQQNTSSLIQAREGSAERGERRLDQSRELGERRLGMQERALEETAARGDVNARLRAANEEIKVRTSNYLYRLKPEEREDIANKYRIAPQDLVEQTQKQTTKNPFESMKPADRSKLVAAVDATIASKGSKALEGNGFVMDFAGKRYRVYKSEDGETHIDLE